MGVLRRATLDTHHPDLETSEDQFTAQGVKMARRGTSAIKHGAISCTIRGRRRRVIRIWGGSSINIGLCSLYEEWGMGRVEVKFEGLIRLLKILGLRTHSKLAANPEMWLPARTVSQQRSCTSSNQSSSSVLWKLQTKPNANQSFSRNAQRGGFCVTGQTCASLGAGRGRAGICPVAINYPTM